MTKKRAGILILLFVFITTLFAGCGAKSDKEAKGVTELEFFSNKSENIEIMTKLVDEFNKQNEGSIKVKLQAPPDAATVLKTRMTKDDMPDIVAFGGDNMYTELTSAKVLVDLSEEPAVSNVIGSYVDMVYNINADKDKKLYGIPYATNACGVIYNKDIFAKASIEVPKTWTEFIDACKKLKEAGITPFEMTFKDAWTTLPIWNNIVPMVTGAEFTNERKEGKVTFADTHKEVLQKFLQLIPYSQNDYMGTSYGDGNKNFANGSAAMLLNGNWAISEIKTANADCNIGMFTLPAIDDTSKNKVVSGIDVMLMVTTQCKKPEAAKKFLAYMFEKESAQKYIDDQFAFSTVKGVAQKDPSVELVSEDIQSGKVVDFTDHYYPNGFDLASVLSEFLLNKTNGMDDAENIDATLKKCDEQYDVLNVK